MDRTNCAQHYGPTHYGITPTAKLHKASTLTCEYKLESLERDLQDLPIVYQFKKTFFIFMGATIIVQVVPRECIGYGTSLQMIQPHLTSQLGECTSPHLRIWNGKV